MNIKPTMISIDPGVHKLACTLWDGDTPREFLWLHIRNPYHGVLLIKDFFPKFVITEIPQHDARTAAVNTQDVLDLAMVAGALLGMGALGVQPRDWKGNLSKEITTARAMEAIGPHKARQLAKTCAKQFQHNLWDSVAIGLWAIRQGLNR